VKKTREEWSRATHSLIAYWWKRPNKTISDVKKRNKTRFFHDLNMTVVWFQNQKMALKSTKRLFFSIDGVSIKLILLIFSAIFIANALYSQNFDAELMLRTAGVHLSCYENNFSEIDFWRQKVEKTIPFLNLKKNDEKIFFDFMLFSGAGMINTQETLDKTISDVKKMN
jgi:hypothetical protein